MQILRTPPFPTLPAPQEPLRERTVAQTGSLTVQSPVEQPQRATWAVEDIRAAEGMLNRQRNESHSTVLTQEGRQLRGVAAYQSMLQSDERAYVSEVLGIDVYA